MTNVRTLIPAMAFAIALAPIAGAGVFAYGAAQDTAYLSTPAAYVQLAANSKGRPGEFASHQVAANSKGRPGEFSTTHQVAANSKGRPGEFNTAPVQAG